MTSTRCPRESCGSTSFETGRRRLDDEELWTVRCKECGALISALPSLFHDLMMAIARGHGYLS